MSLGPLEPDPARVDREGLECSDLGPLASGDVSPVRDEPRSLGSAVRYVEGKEPAGGVHIRNTRRLCNDTQPPFSHQIVNFGRARVQQHFHFAQKRGPWYL